MEERAMTATIESTTPSGNANQPSRRSSHALFYVMMLALLVIGAILCWHFGVFSRSPRLALVVGEAPYWDLVIRGAQDAADRYDVKLTVIRSKPDVDAQSEIFRDVAGREFDGVAVSPVSPQAQAAVLT